MNAITEQRVQNVTSKGQFTLPAKWRKKYNVTQVLVRMVGNQVIVTPIKEVKEMK